MDVGDSVFWYGRLGSGEIGPFVGTVRVLATCGVAVVERADTGRLVILDAEPWRVVRANGGAG